MPTGVVTSVIFTAYCCLFTNPCTLLYCLAEQRSQTVREPGSHKSAVSFTRGICGKAMAMSDFSAFSAYSNAFCDISTDINCNLEYKIKAKKITFCIICYFIIYSGQTAKCLLMEACIPVLAPGPGASSPGDGSRIARMCSWHIIVLCWNNDLVAREICEVCLASYHRCQCI